MLNLSRRQTFQTSVLGGVAFLAAKTSLAQTNDSTENALALMKADPRFSHWIEVLQFSGLAPYASYSKKFTAFIPTNKAFQKYPGIMNTVLRERDLGFPNTFPQVQFVRSHVIPGTHPLSEVAGKKETLASVSGSPITIDGSQAPNFVVTWSSVNSATATAHFVDKPIVASNGLIYSFDDVVLS